MASGIRIPIRLLIDSILIILACYVSLLLRFDGNIPRFYMDAYWFHLPIIVLITLSLLAVFKIYQRVWVYASINELMAIVGAITSSTLIVVLVVYSLAVQPLPKSVYIMNYVFITMLIGISRLWWRLYRDYFNHKIPSGLRVLIVGAGDAGAMLAREIQNNLDLGLNAVAFVDDDRSKRGKLMMGISVKGGRHTIPRLVESMEIDEIIIAMPSVAKSDLKEIVNICNETAANVKILPDIYHTSDDCSMITHLRDVRMEDLLSRDAVVVDLVQVAGYIQDKVVLVTGAGGSIGSELCRQICGFKPRLLVMVESCENNIFDIEWELSEYYNCDAIAGELVDVRNRGKVEQIFKKYRPQVVFHAAAYKHVPMMERHPEEALYNNVMGTTNVAEMADKYFTSTFILISTDKAVNPTSVMGATKRIAELVVKDINRNSETRFAAVRFGNVLGSRGSVVPTFMKQIAHGGPVTVTHPDMTRYFMTIPEAVELVIQAGALATGGEIFVLDMGEPVKIANMARDLIKLSGYEPEKDIGIKYTGLRPGEKLFEELFNGWEEISATRHDRIFISQKELDERYSGIHNTIGIQVNRAVKDNTAVNLILSLVPEYHGSLRPVTDSGPIKPGELIYLDKVGERKRDSR